MSLQPSIPKMMKHMEFLDAQIKEKDKEIRRLQDENNALKRCVMEAVASWPPFKIPPGISLLAPEEREPRWVDQVEKFEQIARQVVQIVVDLVRVTGKSVRHEAVAEVYRKRYGPVKPETIRRRCQELRRQGYLTSPRRGEYLPGPELGELVKQEMNAK